MTSMYLKVISFIKQKNKPDKLTLNIKPLTDFKRRYLKGIADYIVCNAF